MDILISERARRANENNNLYESSSINNKNVIMDEHDEISDRTKNYLRPRKLLRKEDKEEIQVIAKTKMNVFSVGEPKKGIRNYAGAAAAFFENKQREGQSTLLGKLEHSLAKQKALSPIHFPEGSPINNSDRLSLALCRAQESRNQQQQQRGQMYSPIGSKPTYSSVHDGTPLDRKLGPSPSPHAVSNLSTTAAKRAEVK